MSRRLTPCNLNRGGWRGVEGHRLCKMLMVSILACQIFFFAPCLLVLCFTISVPAQRGMFLLTRLPMAPSHPFQELSLLTQASSSTCLPPSLGGVPAAPPQLTTTSAVPANVRWGWAGRMSATFLVFYRSGYLLLDKPFQLPNRSLTSSRQISARKVGCVLTCDC